MVASSSYLKVHNVAGTIKIVPHSYVVYIFKHKRAVSTTFPKSCSLAAKPFITKARQIKHHARIKRVHREITTENLMCETIKHARILRKHVSKFIMSYLCSWLCVNVCDDYR